MSIIFDGQSLRLYPFGKPGFSGGTEGYVRTIAAGLAERGHLVHVVTPDLEWEEQRGEREWWWGPRAHPTRADIVVAIHNTEFMLGYVGQHFVLMPNGIDPYLGEDDAAHLSAVACFSQSHRDLLTATRPSIDAGICHVTGLGVHLQEYNHHRTRRVPGRMVWANDPARGLHHMLAIFDEIRKEMPEAELLIAYDFARQFAPWRYQATAMAELLWECEERIERGDGVRSVGQLPRAELIDLQRSCDLHVMPSDPPNVGSQIHGLTQLEMAAAGVPLILSNIEAFPEIFPDATLLPVPGTFYGSLDRRFDARDWADQALKLLQDKRLRSRHSTRSRQMAAGHDWSAVLDRWEAMLSVLPLD